MDVLRWLESRLDYRHKLRGGLVLTDRLPKDEEGQLLVNLDKLDQTVVSQGDKHLKGPWWGWGGVRQTHKQTFHKYI